MKPRRPKAGEGRIHRAASPDWEKLLGSAPVRRLPRVLVTGPPGAGKSAMLEAAGLRRTALPDDDPSGWTCWTGEHMIAFEASVGEAQSGGSGGIDGTTWKTGLTALQRSRPSRPVDAVVVAVRLEAGSGRDDPEARLDVKTMRARLDEAQALFDMRPPLAVLFTHADRLDGFEEFFGDGSAALRSAPPGVWMQRPRLYASSWAESAFDRLCADVHAIAPDRIERVDDLRGRAAAFAFPAALASARDAILGVLSDLAGASSAAPVLGFGLAAVPAPDRAIVQSDVFAEILPGAATDRIRHPSRLARLWRGAGLAAAMLAAVALLAGWGLIFVRERALIAETRLIIANLKADSEALLQAPSVDTPDFENVLEVLAALHDLPAGSASTGEPAAWERWSGLSRKTPLAAAAEAAYGQALERLLRPRLMLALRESVEAGLRDPGELYQPLKAYLMLGGAAPVLDRGLILGWAQHDWEVDRYPGPTNRAGREQLRAHLEAMLRLGAGRPPPSLVDRALAETAQRALARMDLPDRALALIRSSTYSANLSAFSLAEAVGPQAGTLFETADGRSLSSLSVSGLYTAAGFSFFLDQLSSVAERLEQDRWVMSAGGEAVGVEERLRRLGPDLLERYSREYMAAWTDMLEELRLKPLSAGEPDFPALATASASDSPLRRLVEAVAGETQVTAAAGGFDGGAEAIEGLSRIGITPPSAKSQTRAGGTLGGDFASPGSVIEARFRPFRMLVMGEPGLRPIDVLVRNLAEIRQSLQAGDSAYGGRLQLQVLNLRTNASRLPPPLSKMLEVAADAFDTEVAEASVSQLDRLVAETIGSVCRAALVDAFPFGKGGRDLPLPDFVRLFGPNGEFDRFFSQNLASLVDVSGQEWRWRTNTRLGRDLSTAALRSFQRAMDIRDAFFRTGSPTPGVSLTFKPVALSKDAEMALLDVNGTLVHVYPDGNVPTSVTWPDPGIDGSASLNLMPAVAGRQSALRFEGPWALLRLVSAATRSVAAEAVDVRFVVGGRDVGFSVTSDARLNLLALPLFEEFECPAGL